MSGSWSGRAGLLLLVWLAGCAGLPDDPGAPEGRREVTVEADGWAPVGDAADALTARKRALAEAQKKAVEKAVGVTLRARTRVDDAVNVKQSIEANLGGTIRRYEVLSEGPDGAFFKVRIKADVLARPLAPPPGLRPLRFAVRIPNERVATAVRSMLASSEFALAESDAGADVVVTGVVETHGLADLRLGGFYSYKARVTLSVSELRSGKTSELANESQAIDLDEHAACDAALEKAGGDAGLAIASLFTPGVGAAAPAGAAVAEGPPPAP